MILPLVLCTGSAHEGMFRDVHAECNDGQEGRDLFKSFCMVQGNWFNEGPRRGWSVPHGLTMSNV